MPKKKDHPVTIVVAEYGYCGMPPGTRIAVDPDLAAELIASGHATPVGSS